MRAVGLLVSSLKKVVICPEAWKVAARRIRGLRTDAAAIVRRHTRAKLPDNLSDPCPGPRSRETILREEARR